MTASESGLYRITAELGTAMASGHHLNLDGIVIAATAPPDVPMPTRLSPEAPELWPIPIARVSHQGMAVYLSSNIILDPGATFQQLNWTGRRDAQDVSRLTRKFNRGGGPDRDKVGRARLASARAVSWLAWLEEPEELLDILRMRVDSLGGLRAHGHGAVRTWNLAPVDGGRPWDAWFTPGGYTLRALPADWLRDPVDATPLPVRPPYWHHASLTLAAPEGTPARGGLTQALDGLLAAPSSEWNRPAGPPPHIAGMFGFPPAGTPQ